MKVWRNSVGAMFHDDCAPLDRSGLTSVLAEDIDADDICDECRNELLEDEEFEDDPEDEDETP